MSNLGKYDGDVAIIGMACRFPGAASLAEYWSNLAHGVESIRFFEDEELLASGVDPLTLRDPDYVKAAPVLEDFDKFDAAFFGFNPREVARMDPQHRLLLETAVAALEDAACDPARVDGRIGVFVGGAMNTYFASAGLAAQFATEYLPTLIGNDKDFMATRVSYKLNLTGPSITVQTACSTSLVAAHLACQSLLNEECDAALTGGVSVRVPHHVGYRYEQQGVFSRDGHCRPFDASASGTIFGSGVGIVVLKRMADALRDHDHIYAVVKGSAVNNDGSSKADYTAPSVGSQSEVIAEALAVARADSATIGCVEAHGTGTYMGDPIEVEALTKAFRAGTDRTGYCALGSVKSNFGHLDAAAGVAGLMKAALALQNKTLLPTLNFTECNPLIDFGSSPFFVSSTLRDWVSDGPRRAGVTSLGIGGTNVHMVLEEAPVAAPSGSPRSFQLLVLSAKSRAALDEGTTDLAESLVGQVSLADVAYTCQVGRSRKEHRRMLVCRDTADARDALGNLDKGRVFSVHERDRTRPIVFLFPGHGAQYRNMGVGLYETEPVFRAALDSCLEILKDVHSVDLTPYLCSAESDAAVEFVAPALTHPALFAVEYAIAQLWGSWGISPDVVMGHSFGEYAACCVAGVLTREEALALAVQRGRLMEQTAPGSMLIVPLSEKELEHRLGTELSLACINAPGLCVASGPVEELVQLQDELAQSGLDATRVTIGFAAHSKLIDPVLDTFREFLRTLHPKVPRIPVVSGVTGQWMTAEEATDPSYWVRNLRRPVRFAEGMAVLLREPDRIFLETGPGSTLTSLGKLQPGREETHTFVTSLRHPRHDVEDTVAILENLGKLWLAGAHIDWAAYHAGERRRRVSLPTYAFQRQRYWMESAESQDRRASRDGTYAYTWKRSPPISATETESSSWLVLCDKDGLGKDVAARLREAGHTVTTVPLGHNLEELEDAPQHVVHFAPSFFQLLDLAKWLGERATELVRLDVITCGLFDVTGDEVLNPEMALSVGVAKVAGNENPLIRSRVVDVAEPDAAKLVAELTHAGSETEVAHRGRHRWVRVLEPVTVVEGPSRLKEGGVYLITGGLGGVGSKVAAVLAKKVHAKLVLVSRTPYPAGADDPRRGQVEDLERLGAEILVCRADVVDTSQMATVVGEARERFGRIDGVIHAAGTLDNRIIPLKDRDSAEKVLAPKTKGTQVLHELLPDLDFFVLFSSIMSVLGPPGSVDYAAGNAYLDAFALANRDTFTLSISWPGWKDTGLAAGTAVRSDIAEMTITPERGVEIFLRLLNGNVNHVIVAATDPRSIRVDRAAPEEDDGDGTDERAELATAYVAPEGDLEEAVAAVWQKLLGVDRIGVRDNFADLGGHSLLAIQVISRLRKALRVDLTIKDIFERPTIAALALHIEELILAEVER